MENKKQNVFFNLTSAVPFDGAYRWAYIHSDWCVNWIPRYTDKQTQKKYKQWLKDNGKNN